jgi:hypothetical protein
MPGSDADRAFGRAPNLEEPGLPARGVRLVGEEREDLLDGPIDHDRVFDLDHRLQGCIGAGTLPAFAVLPGDLALELWADAVDEEELDR